MSSSDFKAFVNRCMAPASTSNVSRFPTKNQGWIVQISSWALNITRTKVAKGQHRNCSTHRNICRTSPTTIFKTTTRSFLGPHRKSRHPQRRRLSPSTSRHILLISDCRFCGAERFYTGVSLGRGMPPIVSCRVGCNGVTLPHGEYGRMGGYRGQPPGSGRSGQFQRLVSTGCVYIGAYIRVFWSEGFVNLSDWSVGWCEMATAWDVVGRVKSTSIFAGFDLGLSK